MAGLAVVALVVLLPVGAVAQARRPRLVVSVADQTGAVIQHATVSLARQEPEVAGAPPRVQQSDDNGVAAFDGLDEGRYTIQVEFPGFDPAVVRDVRVRSGDTRRRVVLRIKKIDEAVTVRRDRQSSALDPAGSAFSSVLTREQIDALPDDPDEMKAVLEALSPPGSVIRVDGFTGGRLPPKSQIRSIRLPRMDMFAAQNHGGTTGTFFIDIMTQPGSGPLRGNLDFNFLDEALNARNAFTPDKADEQVRRYGYALYGTIAPNRTSFSINGGGGYQYTSPNLFAVMPDGTTRTDTLRQPRDGVNVSVRLDHAVNKDHALRVSADYERSRVRNLGVGGYDLFERAYRTQATTSTLRLTENGPIGRRMFTESRLQLRWGDNRSVSGAEAPTTRVLDAFTSGGAQQRGGQESFGVELASDLDYVRGPHSWRTGLLLEGGWYSSDDLTNYLGTYTFASLDDYEQGRAGNYTRRVGDPAVRYSTLQAAAYVQDDWRVSRGLLVSGGLRYGAQRHVSDGWNLSPRVTVAWSPSRRGHVTIRGGYGYFYDWIAGDLYKQTLLVDGERQREINIDDPSYPDPGVDGATAPTNKYLWSDDLVLPTAHRVTAGLERALGENARLTFTYSRGWGQDLLRGRNLNAPVNGARPDPSLANEVALAGDARSRSQALTVFYSLAKPSWRRTFLGVNYTWAQGRTNTAGPFALPAAGDDPNTEWGAAAGDVRHRLGASLNTSPRRNLSLGLNLRAQSGSPYNVTTGRDDNGDGLYDDRPAGVSRNSARGSAQVDLGGRLSYAIGFGTPRQSGGAGGPQIVIQAGGGGGLAPGFGGGAEDKRYRIEFYVSGQNLLNRVNYTGYSFVMTSPLFGQPVAAAQPRKLQVGVRFGF
jgi:hypothetical protein